jgi:glyoxylase-like metal-dependent hydrolase (beta-lactamase superfamily II)
MNVADNLYLALYGPCKIGMGVNVYAMRDAEGIVLIDGGLEPEVETIRAQLRIFGMRLEQIRFLVATHCHFDHYETFNELRKISGAQVLAHRLDAEVLEAADHRTGWHVRGVWGLQPKPPAPVKVDRKLEDGDEIALGKMRLKVIHAPGHTHGSICLSTTVAGQKALFTGDVVMPSGPTTGTTGWRGSPTQDVNAYRETLLRLSALDVDWLLSGHNNISLKDGWRHISHATNEFLIAHPASPKK